MKTIAKSAIIVAALVSLASCDFFKKGGETETSPETASEVTTTGINTETIDTTAGASATTVTGIDE